MSDVQQARAAKDHLAAELRDRDGILGVGLMHIGPGFGVRVNVRNAETARQVPRAVDGVEVRIVVVGTTHAQD